MKKKLLIPAFLVAASLSANAASIHAGLLNYWPLDGDANDVAGSIAESTGTSTDNGTVNGSVSFAAGILGSGGSFPGGAGNHISVPDPTGGTDDIDRTGADLSISIWVNLANRDTGWQGIIAHGEAQDYRVALRGTNNPVPVAYAGGGASSDIVSTTTIGPGPAGDNLWHHIVATTQGSVTKLYVDGVLNVTGGTGTILENGTNQLWIGGNPDNGRQWNGMLDDVGMWDRALTDGEVALIHSQGLSGTALGAITVPEPSSFALALLGGLGLLRRRR
ncbi:MAG: LamG domain-containing protein [Verrucomicrobiaceae bacterium]